MNLASERSRKQKTHGRWPCPPSHLHHTAGTEPRRHPWWYVVPLGGTGRCACSGGASRMHQNRREFFLVNPFQRRGRPPPARHHGTQNSRPTQRRQAQKKSASHRSRAHPPRFHSQLQPEYVSPPTGIFMYMIRLKTPRPGALGQRSP